MTEWHVHYCSDCALERWCRDQACRHPTRVLCDRCALRAFIAGDFERDTYRP